MEINLKLSVNETNAILLSLAKLPYDTVAQLIEKIRSQALPQVPESERADDRREQLRRDLVEKLEAEDVGNIPMPK